MEADGERQAARAAAPPGAPLGTTQCACTSVPARPARERAPHRPPGAAAGRAARPAAAAPRMRSSACSSGRSRAARARAARSGRSRTSTPVVVAPARRRRGRWGQSTRTRSPPRTRPRARSRMKGPALSCVEPRIGLGEEEDLHRCAGRGLWLSWGPVRARRPRESRTRPPTAILVFHVLGLGVRNQQRPLHVLYSPDAGVGPRSARSARWLACHRRRARPRPAGGAAPDVDGDGCRRDPGGAALRRGDRAAARAPQRARRVGRAGPARLVLAALWSRGSPRHGRCDVVASPAPPAARPAPGSLGVRGGYATRPLARPHRLPRRLLALHRQLRPHLRRGAGVGDRRRADARLSRLAHAGRGGAGSRGILVAAGAFGGAGASAPAAGDARRLAIGRARRCAGGARHLHHPARGETSPAAHPRPPRRPAGRDRRRRRRRLARLRCRWCGPARSPTWQS